MDMDYTRMEIFEEGHCSPTQYAGGRYVHISVANPIDGIKPSMLIAQDNGVIKIFSGMYNINVEVSGGLYADRDN